MMTSIYKDRYVEIFLDLERSLIFDVWTEASEEIYDNEQIFKDFLIVWRDAIINNNIKYALTDIRKLRYNPPPEIQENELRETMQLMNANGFLRIAFIAADDFIQLLMMEQLKDEQKDAAQREVSNFFLNEDEAIAWLMSGGDSNGISSGTTRLIGLLITFGSFLGLQDIIRLPKQLKTSLSS